MIRTAIIGPGPGAPGGIGIMAGHLAGTRSDRTSLVFRESGGAPGPTPRRLMEFLRTAAHCLGPSTTQFRVFAVASRGSTWRKLILSSLTRLRRRPYALHLHGGGFDAYFRSRGRLEQALVRGMFRAASQVIVLGESWARFVGDELGVAAADTAVLPNAVPGPAEISHRGQRPARVLFAGRVGRRKGDRKSVV